MSERVFGNASDFYRLRVVAVEGGEAPDLVWRDDILWRTPSAEPLDESLVFRVEAVSLDEDETAVPLADFDDRASACEWLEETEADLGVMTKAEFERAYMQRGPE